MGLLCGKLSGDNTHDSDLDLESNNAFDTSISWLNSRSGRCHHCDRALEPGNKFCVGCSLCIKHQEKKCYECIKNQKTLKWLNLSITEGPQINERFFAKNGIDEPKHNISGGMCIARMFNEHCAINVHIQDLECGEEWAATQIIPNEYETWFALNDVV